MQGLPIYEETLMRIPTGCRTTVVATILVRDPVNGHICQSEVYGQKFRYVAPLEDDTTSVTLLNFPVTHIRRPTLTLDEHAVVLQHKCRQVEDYQMLAETCTGLGGIGVGAEYAGWEVRVMNELQDKFVQHMKQYESSKVVGGSICHLNTVAQMHAMDPNSACMSWGFSCQPFSALGDGKQGQDERSATLPMGLYAAFLLRKEVLVLECVPQAASSAFVQRCIKHHMDIAKFTKTEAILELSDLWPAKRRRWWVVLLKEFLGKVFIDRLPKIDPMPNINSVLPDFLQVDDSELSQLQLSQHERDLFTHVGRGLAQQMVNPVHPMETALHSWGNQVTQCACGCRGPLSMSRLEQSGLFGALVSQQTEIGQVLRHISPKEVAILNGMVKKAGWSDDQRLLLAGLGQLASPIQAGWVFAQLHNHLADVGLGRMQHIKPKVIVARICEDVLEMRDMWWGQSKTCAMQLFEEALTSLLRPEPIPAAPVHVQSALEDIPTQDLIHAVELADQTRPTATDHPAEHTVVEAAVDQHHPEQPLPREASFAHDHPSSPPDATDGDRAPHDSHDIIQVEPSEAHEEDPQQKSSHVNDPSDAESPAAATVIPQGPSRSFPGDERTGALDAFRTETPRGPAKKRPSSSSSDDERPGSIHEPTESVSSENENAPVIQTAEQRMPTPILDVITHGGIIHADVANDSRTGHKFAEGQTLQNMCDAQAALTHEQPVFQEAVGTKPHMSQVMTDIQLVITGTLVGHHITDMQELEETLTQMPREVALLHQCGAVAVDEMEYYMSSLATFPGLQGTVSVVKPLVVESFCDAHAVSEEWVSRMTSVQVGASAILWGHHWIPVVSAIVEEERIITSTPLGVAVLEQLSPPPEQTRMNECAEVASQLYWQQVVMFPQEPGSRVRIGGQTELETAIQALLREHGVPGEKVHSRMKTIIGKIGIEQLAAVFRQPRPWQSLKQLANSQNPRIRLVAKDELQAVIKSRAKAGPVASKKATRTDERPVHIPPEDVKVPDAIFCQEDGVPLTQLMSRQITQYTKGVIMISEHEMQPYLTQGQLSHEGLGFLVLSPFSEATLEYGQLIRFPAASLSSGEPLLLSAVLIQKGAKKVGRNTPAQLQAVQQVSTQTVKILMYRDQVKADWETVSMQPIKHVLSLVPNLRKCTQHMCKCTAWHPSSPDQDGPILDLWQRDFINLHFRKTKPSDAAVFTCCIRVLEPVFQELFLMSGVEGVFFEPRGPDGRGQDAQFQTVWLPKQSLADAKATQATLGEPSSLIRVNMRYGLKVAKDKAEFVHQKVHPDEPFMAGTTQSFKIGPMPWGTTKKTLMALFQGWGWRAKAISPAGRSADGAGLMWLVVSAVQPPSTAFTLQHGDIVILKDEVPTKQQWKPPIAQASQHTLNQHRALQDGLVDPWAEAAKQLPSRNSSSIQMAAIEVQHHVQQLKGDDDDSMQPAAWEPRMQQLEQQIAQLHAGQQSMTQQAASFEQKLEYLNQNMEHHVKQFSHTVDNKLTEQMGRLEALLEKRLRKE
eukprot:Skav207248  [mRNA]  locus=scaffold523:674131:678772:- [translate_table: standard]